MLKGIDVPAANLDAINNTTGPEIFRLIQQAQALVKRSGSAFMRYDELIDIAENVSRAITPHTPCKKGCSHCCYMAVAISEIEANAISRYTGRPMVYKPTVSDFLQNADRRTEELTGVPCTFLVEGKCSIYPVRPIPCRLHHNLAVDETNCIVKDAPLPLKNTPTLNLTGIHHAAVDIAMTQAKVGFGDIRDYFPDNRK